MDALRERFGKYHVLEKIAQGGMAEVYKVKTVGIAGFEKVQALKRILPNSAREGRFIRSFIDEARIAVELTHRNIVQVFDFGKADGELFLAMELIEGKDLRTSMGQAVSRDLMPPIPVAAYIISEVAAGLDYAHRKTDGYGGTLGIVHCDVSPSNVMLSTDGYVKILDFGIARASFASALERRRLRGKPRYMAPEQTLGEPPTAGADVFALGIIAWELFTGLPLYRGPNLKAILEAVRTTHPPRIDRLNAKVPKEIADAVALALSREPTARGTAADLGQACTRSAMAAGARALATWLADLDTRPSTTAIPWQPEVTSVSVPKPTTASSSMSGAPMRPSARSITQSLANVPAPGGDFGEGTPGFSDPQFGDAATSTDAQRLARAATSTGVQRFEGKEPSTTAVSRYEATATAVAAPPRPDATVSGTGPRYLEPTATSTRWGTRAPSRASAASPMHSPMIRTSRASRIASPPCPRMRSCGPRTRPCSSRPARRRPRSASTTTPPTTAILSPGLQRTRATTASRWRPRTPSRHSKTVWPTSRSMTIWERSRRACWRSAGAPSSSPACSRERRPKSSAP